MLAVLGITAWRTGFDRPKAVMGLQPERIGGAITWVVPNPSGLNAHFQVADLARIYRAAAGIATDRHGADQQQGATGILTDGGPRKICPVGVVTPGRPATYLVCNRNVTDQLGRPRRSP